MSKSKHVVWADQTGTFWPNWTAQWDRNVCASPKSAVVSGAAPLQRSFEVLVTERFMSTQRSSFGALGSEDIL